MKKNQVRVSAGIGPWWVNTWVARCRCWASVRRATIGTSCTQPGPFGRAGRPSPSTPTASAAGTSTCCLLPRHAVINPILTSSRADHEGNPASNHVLRLCQWMLRIRIQWLYWSDLDSLFEKTVDLEPVFKIWSDSTRLKKLIRICSVCQNHSRSELLDQLYILIWRKKIVKDEFYSDQDPGCFSLAVFGVWRSDPG